jgi:hypothetical protein
MPRLRFGTCRICGERVPIDEDGYPICDCEEEFKDVEETDFGLAVDPLRPVPQPATKP